MAAEEGGEYYLELSPSPVRFESVSKVTNVFFDDCNEQVFAVRSGGATGVVVKGPTEHMSTSFRMDDKGPVISIKFSPDQRVLAIQRSKTSVEFVNFLNESDPMEYSQSCKGKNTIILGFVWTSDSEIVFITDHGVELFQVLPEKRILKAVKNHSMALNWFVYCPLSKLLLLSSGTLGNVMQPLQFKQGNFYRLSKFEIDLPVIPKPPKLCLLERDITLSILYGQICIIVLRHQPRGVGSTGAEVVIYTLQKMMHAKKSHILRLDKSGRFAVNVVDNLVIVHHQASKTSMIFDINMSGESDGYVTYHQPVTSSSPIKPFKLKLPLVPTQVMTEPAEVNCELYSPNWVVFQPNIIIDAKLGCLWYIQLKLKPLVDLIADKCTLVDFLLQRTESKPVVIKVLQHILEPKQQPNLVVIANVFDRLNDVYRSFLEVEMQSQMAMPASGSATPKPGVIVPKAQIVIDQSDMYTNVFSQFADMKNTNGKFVIAVLIEYIRSLTDFQIPVQHYLYELVINALVHHKMYYQLHQFLQYHVVCDSKPLACLLLSLENLYPAAHQLALDMLKRLSTANEEIIEVLLSKQQILSALRFVRSTGSVDQVSARKFLDAAKNTGDAVIFFSVFKFFEQRNIKLKGSPSFLKGEHCDVYVEHFHYLFPNEKPQPKKSSYV